jgi:hypothetical protein
MIENEKEHFDIKLLHFLSLSFKQQLTNVSIKEVFMMLNSIEVNFVYKEVEKGSYLKTKKGFFGGTAWFNKNTKKYTIDLIIYNCIKEDTWEELIEFIVSASVNDLITKNISFTYLHEMQHIFQKHFFYYDKFEIIANAMLQTINAKGLDKDLNVSELLNVIFDYHINSVIKNTGMFSELFKNKEKINFLWSERYNASKMSEVNILEDILKNGNIEIIEFNKKDKIIILEITVDEYTRQIILSLDVEKTENILENGSEEDMNNAVNNAITGMKSGGLVKIMEQLGLPIVVETSWIDKLDTSLNNISYTYSKNKKKSWAKTNMFYRNVSLPGSKKIKENKEAYIVIDYSGSMSANDIRKINFIVLKLHNKGFNLNILGHTVKLEIVKKFKRNEDKLKEYVKYRHISGGTSHIEVFDYLETDIPEGQRSITLILSDMMSDIEEIWNNYKWHLNSDVVMINTGSRVDKMEKFCYDNNREYIEV